MSVVSVKTARRMTGEPLKQYSWEVVIPDPPLILIGLIYGVSLRARGASIPGVGNETFRTFFGPFVYSHAGKRTYPRRFSLRLEEGYDWPILPVLTLWNEAIFGEGAGAGSDEEDLVSNIWIRILGPKMEPTGLQVTQSVHIYNAFPVDVPDSPLAYESSSQVFFDVTFAYDYWRYELWPF